MRYTDKQIKAANALRDRINEYGIQALKKSDLRTAIIHVGYLFQCGERISAGGWQVAYSVRFRERWGVVMPFSGSDLRAVSSVANGRKGGRPSLRPDYCTMLQRKTCRGCPQSAAGADCLGYKISGRWGKAGA